MRLALQVLAGSFAAEFAGAAAACEQELCDVASGSGDAPAPAPLDYSGRQPKEASISDALEAVLEELVFAAFDQECDGAPMSAAGTDGASISDGFRPRACTLDMLSVDSISRYYI